MRHSLLIHGSNALKPRRRIGNTEMETQDKVQSDSLYKWNLAAGILHVCSFIAALGVSIRFASGSFMSEINTAFRVYDAGASGPVPYATHLVSLGFYPLIWVDLPFPLITALFHLFIALHPRVRAYYEQRVFHEEQAGNPLRWLEYSITASLMIWVIMQLSGVTELFLLLVVGVVCNVALQWMGYLQEELKGRSWMPTIVGWLLFVGQWVVVMSYFFSAITSPRPPGTEAVPWFVYSIIIGLFFIFATFGLIQLCHLLGWPRWLIPAYNVEKAYIFMSMTAKLFLTWNLLIGISINPMA